MSAVAIDFLYSTHTLPAAKAEQPARKPVAGFAKLPAAPVNGSPVPHLTSLYHFAEAGDYGSRAWPGNCGGNLIRAS